jgi:hypothetical protein
VWQNTCRFCRISESKNRFKDNYFYEKLIIACFFHDTGLLENTGEMHGKLSRQICEKFLSMHSKKIQFDLLEVLEAIENHDNKKYELFNIAEGLNVYNILSVAATVCTHLLPSLPLQ